MHGLIRFQRGESAPRGVAVDDAGVVWVGHDNGGAGPGAVMAGNLRMAGDCLPGHPGAPW